MPEARALIGLGFATALVFWGTPVAIRVAARLNFYDKPFGYKGHSAPTPYLGGAPVVVAFLAVLAILTSDWERTLPLAGGVMALWGLGTLDDRRTVSPAIRVGAEIALASVLFWTGTGWHLGGPSIVGLLVTIAWVVGVVNALNLFDNMDGAASSIALAISAGVAVAGAIQGDVWLSVAAAGLCGACLGFLPHNLATPARIFLGDGGSMPLGFALAAMVMAAGERVGPTWQALAMGVLLVGVPALDTCLVIVSRRRRGISILTGGRDHLTHRTFQRLRTTRAVAFALGSAQALLAALALLGSQQSSSVVLVLLLLYLVGAATAITMLDRGAERTAVAVDGAVAKRSIARPEFLVLAVLGAGAGISPFLAGFYDLGAWAPIGLGLLVVLTAVTIAGPLRLSGAGAVALCSLTALGALALLSSSWSGSTSGAVVNGNRYLVYAVFLALVLALVRDARAALVLVAGFAAGAVVVGASDLVGMLNGDPGIFLGGRLNSPLGYINGQGSFLVLAAWPLLALAEQARVRWLAGVGLMLATVSIGLALTTQSRGVALAIVASAVAAVVLVPGRRRRLAALFTLAAGLAACAPLLGDLVHSSSGAISAAAERDFARGLVIASIAVGAIWWIAVEIENVARRDAPRVAAALRQAFSAGVALVIVAAVGLTIANAGTLRRDVTREYHAFVRLDPTQGGDSTRRLVSGGGNRYDYWRVAADAWKGHPIAGIGGGSYSQPYYRHRATAEAIQQPHSIELQTLAELGLLGAVLLVLMLGATVYGVRAARRRALESPLERALLVVCVGCLAAWSVHTSVDWMHLLPGITAVPLIAMGVLLRRGRETAPRRSWGPRRRAAIVATAAILAAVAATSLTRSALADWFRSRAQSALVNSPADSLKWANRSLRLDPDSPSTYYIKAAALARFGAGSDAERVLQTAIDREPGNFLSYALLGDLYTREGKTSLAKHAYGNAFARNPLEPGLARLAGRPAAGGTPPSP